MACLRNQRKHRQHADGTFVDYGAQPLGQRARDVFVKPAARDVRDGADITRFCGGEHRAHIDACGRQKFSPSVLDSSGT